MSRRIRQISYPDNRGVEIEINFAPYVRFHIVISNIVSDAIKPRDDSLSITWPRCQKYHMHLKKIAHLIFVFSILWRFSYFFSRRVFRNFFHKSFKCFITCSSLYLYPIRKLSEVKVLAIVESDRIGILLREFASIQALLQCRQAVKGAE